MFRNYLKLAWRVLGRNKFYTFISLFGISFTLMVLMLATAFLNNEFGANAPLSNIERIVHIPMLRMQGFAVEQTVTIDSTETDGQMVYDTTVTERKLMDQPNNTSNSGVGFDFYKEYLKPLSGPELISVFNARGQMDVFQNGKKMTLDACYTDANYWKILDFKFLEGTAIDESAVESQAYVAVINEKTAREYFGALPSYLGETITHRGSAYEIIGVIEDVNTSIDMVNLDIFVPYTHMAPANLNYGTGHFGEMEVAMLAPSVDEVDDIYAELEHLETTFDLSDMERFDILKIWKGPIMEFYARQIVQTQENNARKLKTVIFLGLLLFIIIPTINLINLNITRIMERSAEIGVRKSFGARTRDLLFQFLFENIVLTVLGGVIGFVLALLAMALLNGSPWLGRTILELNPRIFFISFLIILVFGIISGLLPAWRMSRTPIAKAIKSNAI